jgi:hypothetical protein
MPLLDHRRVRNYRRNLLCVSESLFSQSMMLDRVQYHFEQPTFLSSKDEIWKYKTIL